MTALKGGSNRLKRRSPKARNLLSPLAALVIVAMPTTACDDDSTGPDGNLAVISVPFEFERDATARTGFRVIGINGGITVTGLSQGETFRVSGFRRVQNCSQAEAQAQIDNLEVEVTETAREIVVQTIQPTNTGRCSLVVDYELSVPERLVGHVVNVNGDVRVDDLDEGVSVTNVNGTVTLDDCEDDTTVRLINGNVTADLKINDDEEIDLLTVNGSVALTIPVGTNAQLSMGLANGTINVTNLTVLNQSTTANSLTGTLGTGEGTIVLRTTNGNLTLTGQ